MAGRCRRKDVVHRARIPRGERLLRELPLKLRDEFLNGEIFSIKELRVLAERWRVHYNPIRPHSSLGYRAPAPQAWLASNSTGYGEVETATRFPLPPHPRRRLSSNIVNRATLTLHLVQKAGQANATMKDKLSEYLKGTLIDVSSKVVAEDGVNDTADLLWAASYCSTARPSPSSTATRWVCVPQSIPTKY